MPRPGRSSPSSPGSRATSGWRSSAPHQPDVVAARRPVDDRPRGDRGGPATARAADAAAARPRRAGARSSRASRANARRPACCSWSPSGRAACPLVAEELLAARRELPTRLADRLVRRAGHGPARGPLARVPPRPAPARPGRPPADRGRSWRRSPRPSRSRPIAPAPRSVSGPRRGDGVLDADLSAGRDEALEHGFLVETDGADRVPARADRAGRRARPAADRPDPPPRRARDGPRRTAVGRRAALAGGARRRAPPGRRRSRPPDLAGEPPRRRRRARRARAGAVAPGATATRTARSRPAAEPRPSRTGSTSRCGPPRRPSRSGGPRGRRPTSRSAIGAPRRPARPGPARPAPRAARPTSAGPPATRPGPMPPRGGPSSSSRASRARSAPRSLAALAQLHDARRHLLRRAAARPRGDQGRPRLRPGRPRPRRSTPRRRSAWRSPGAATRTPRSSCCARPRRRRRELDDPDALFRVTANLTTVLDLVGRRAEAVDVAYRGHRGRAAGRPRGGLRQLPGRQRRRVAVPARSLAARPARSAPGRSRGCRSASSSSCAHRPARDRRDRDGRRRARPRGCSARPSSSSTPLREPQLAGAVLPRRRVVRAVARRRRRRQPVGRSRLGGRPRDRGMGPRRADGRDGRPGRRGRRRRGARAPPAGPAGRRPVSARPRSSRTAAGLVEAGGAPPTAGSRRVAEAYLATARGLPAPPRGRRRPGGLGAGRDDVAGARRRRTRSPSPAGARPRRRWSRRRGAGRPGAMRASRCSRPSELARRARRRRPLLRELRELAGRARIDAARGGGPGARTRPVPPRSAVGAGGRSVATMAHGDGHARERPVRPRAGRSPATRRRPATRPDTFGLSGREREVLVARRPGPDQPRDRGAAVHQPEDRRRPRREHPGQAGGLRPGGGRGRRDPPGPHRAA